MNENKLTEINSKFYQKCEVVMLPTEKATAIVLFDKTAEKRFRDKLVYSPDVTEYREKDEISQHLYILSSEEIKEEKVYGIFKDEIGYTIEQEGVLCFHIPSKNGKGSLTFPYPRNFKNDVKKIIATTDKSLIYKISVDCGSSVGNTIAIKNLPRPSDDFIKAFVKKQGRIDKVLVEYENINVTKKEDYQYNDKTGGNLNYVWKLKVAPDNTITIKPIQEEKASWNKEEVIQLIVNAIYYGIDLNGNLSDKWLEQNL